MTICCGELGLVRYQGLSLSSKRACGGMNFSILAPIAPISFRCWFTGKPVRSHLQQPGIALGYLHIIVLDNVFQEKGNDFRTHTVRDEPREMECVM